MKTIGLVLVIAAITAGAAFAVRKKSTTQADFTEQFNQLHDGNWTNRRTAANDLAARQKPGTVRALLTATRDDQPEVRIVVDRALQSVRDPQTLEWLMSEGLTFPDRWVRYYAVRAVAAKKGPQAVDALLPHLAKNYWQVQLAIVEAVAPYRTPAVTAAVAAAAAPGRHWEVRAEAIRVLGAANTADAANQLLNVAAPASDQDPDPTAEWAVEEALASMGADALAYVADQMSLNKDPARRLLAIKAIGRTKHAAALPELRKIVGDKDAPQPARIAALRAAILACGAEGGQFALDTMPNEDVPFRLEAAGAFAEAELSEPLIAGIRALAEREQNWRVKQALQVALQPR